MGFGKADWEKLNGFDEAFMPAYCEESDFSMRVRHQLKKKVVCVGDSKIFHYGGASYNAVSNVGKGVKLFQEHWAKFQNRWKNEIENDEMSEDDVRQYLENIIQFNK